MPQAQSFTNITPIQQAPPQTFTDVAPIGDQPGFLDKQIPLDSYKDATLSGVQSVGRGIRDAAKGVWNTIAAPPADSTEESIGALSPAALPLYRTLRSLGH